MSGFIVTAAFAAGLAAAAAQPPASDQVRHGAQLAERCAACHAIGTTDHSRNSGAPPFRALARRSNSLGLERELQRVFKTGHFQMRPQTLGDSDATDLAAYIATLERPAR